MSVSHNLITPDWKPLIRVLEEEVLRRLVADLASQCPVEASVIVRDRAGDGEHGLIRLASVGSGGELVEAQIERCEGPIEDAIVSGEPVLTPDVWADSRWPGLARHAIGDIGKQAGARTRGTAVLPGRWGDGAVFAMSCCLERAADETTLMSLRHYEQRVAAVLTVVHAAMVDGSAHVLNMLRTSAVIEQAKGAIIAATGCDADRAWDRLRIASQHLNIKVRDLAFALVEYLGHTPAEQPVGLPRYEPFEIGAATTAKVWSVLTVGIRSA